MIIPEKTVENGPIFCNLRAAFTDFSEGFLIFSILKGITSDTKMPTIKVECYSGYKADEKPISFTLDEKKLMIDKIIDQWRGPESEYLKVLADDGKAYLLRHDEMSGEWALEKVYQY